MVRIADIEELLQRYAKDGDLEKADALYLLCTTDFEEARETLKARYGRSEALNYVINDLLKITGIDLSYTYIMHIEDSCKGLEDIVRNFFKQLCLDMVIEYAKRYLNNLSRSAREILYIISIIYPEQVSINELSKFYKIIFQRDIAKNELEKALVELRKCYIIQDSHLKFPPYIEELFSEIKDVIPKVEIKISWLENI
ncbi:MAG: hypothetical protein QW695_03555 [Candidatus Bathyarchaeia archaeon]